MAKKKEKEKERNNKRGIKKEIKRKEVNKLTPLRIRTLSYPAASYAVQSYNFPDSGYGDPDFGKCAILMYVRRCPEACPRRELSSKLQIFIERKKVPLSLKYLHHNSRCPTPCAQLHGCGGQGAKQTMW